MSEWMSGNHHKTQEHSLCSELSRRLGTRLIHRLGCLRDLFLKDRAVSLHSTYSSLPSASHDSFSINISNMWPFWASRTAPTSWNLLSSWQPVAHREGDLGWAWQARVCCSGERKSDPEFCRKPLSHTLLSCCWGHHIQYKPEAER